MSLQTCNSRLEFAHNSTYPAATMPSPSASIQATDPAINATVSASAGSGKTWLLVTRLIRLLLADQAPGSILALTFTRKAASEMNIRLHERLYELAISDDETLSQRLQECGVTASTGTIQKARLLYEEVLYASHPIRLQTFHAFCQEMLSRFTLEADVPPGFELKEDTSLLEQQVWEALFVEATQHQDSELTQQLERLMHQCNGPANTRTALFSMLQHRSDWWAFTEHQNNAVAYACEQLATRFNIVADSNTHIKQFFDAITHDCEEFCTLLTKHSNKTNVNAEKLINDALNASQSLSERLTIISGAFLTKTGEPLKQGRQLNDTLEKKMGEAGAHRFIALHQQIAEQLMQCIDINKRHLSYQLNRAWYVAGDHLIKRYQQLKRELRVLDFTDLEWHCYQLLSDADNAQWVQYKIDQNIDHILIDEFQDTNPTQWQLLRPLLEEMAASYQAEHALPQHRSVFLVGDEKQSIYSFRRANPALQAQASNWLHNHLNAQATPLDFSWRSSPAIMHFVNAVFQQANIAAMIPGFKEHGTNLKNLPGSVTLLAKFGSDETTQTQTEFRNPLLQPRVIAEANHRQKEAQAIVEHIQYLLDNKLITGYSDIMLLMRNRTHLPIYEQALRQHGMPYVSDQRGGLLDNLEIQDMECLLDVLITPFDNLALAQVLKSPLFNASDEDLLLLARQLKQHRETGNNWYQQLQTMQSDLAPEHPLAQAARMLANWHRIADTIPVHDLLDRIYHEASVIERYRMAAPDVMREQVSSNLQRFIELSLEVDAGRYPSLSQFKHYLRTMRELASDKIDQAQCDGDKDRIRIMTIHGSKGLESPAVFLVDSNTAGNNKNAYQALVEWPETDSRPQNMQLQAGKADTDSVTQAAQQRRLQRQQREDLNLLYVALTRARQFLFISAVESAGENPFAWYALMQQAMQSLLNKDEVGDDALIYAFGEAQDFESHNADSQTQADHAAAVTKPLAEVDENLLHPFNTLPIAEQLLAPSRADDYKPQHETLENNNARLRGMIIHRALELLSAEQRFNTDQTGRILRDEFNDADSAELIRQCLDEALDNIHHPSLKQVFHPDSDVRSHNEFSLMFKTNNAAQHDAVYGIIDRLLVGPEKICIIDYKSHRLQQDETCQQLAQQFSQQMRWYKEGVEKLWPNVPVHCGVLFTHRCELVWLDLA